MRPSSIGAPGDVADDASDKPYLVLIGYDADSVRSDEVHIPPLVVTINRHAGAGGADFRKNLNNLVFVVADESHKAKMRESASHFLALERLTGAERLKEFAAHQQAAINEARKKSITELAIAIQQCYRHLFYPARAAADGAVNLDHSVLNLPDAAADPGQGQKAIVSLLRNLRKLRKADDPPDTPGYVCSKTPLNRGQITTAALRAEYRRNVALDMHVGDEPLKRIIENGIALGEYVYTSGDLVFAKGDPPVAIRIGEDSSVYTAACAAERGIWPRREEPSPADALPEAIEPAGAAGMHDPQPGAEVAASSRETAPPATLSREAEVQADGVLREALVRVWEQARGRRIAALEHLTLDLFDAGDGLRLLSVVNTIASATKQTRIAAHYRTCEGGEMELTFTGSIDDALPIKDFLNPQLRAATGRPDVGVTFDIDFDNGGLSLTGDAAEALTEKLARYVSSEVHVCATPKPSHAEGC